MSLLFDSRLPDRFWSKLVPDDSGCWIWTAYVSPNGYGRFPVNRVSKMAHRVSYEALVGLIPEGLQIDHLCRVRSCVNPEHMEPVTPQENTIRSPLLGLGNRQKSKCPRNHPYDSTNTYVYSRGGKTCRMCRACKRERSRLRRANP